MHPDTLAMLARAIDDDRQREIAVRRLRRMARDRGPGQRSTAPDTPATVSSPPVLYPVPALEPETHEEPPERIAG